MHRLLICYGKTAVIVFSINKNRPIQTLSIRDKLEERGKALAAEWVGIECKEIIVGFEKGFIEVFRAGTNGNRAVRTIDFKPVHMNNLELSVIQRPKNHYYLVIVLTRDMNGAELER